MSTVMANGVFDILHIGHVEHLRAARTMGEVLIVALTEDDCVGKGPGRPINKWSERARVLRSLRFVDCVVPARGAVHAISTYLPDIFVKGIDYAMGDNFTEDVVGACHQHGVELRFTSTPKRSVTDLITRTMELAA